MSEQEESRPINITATSCDDLFTSLVAALSTLDKLRRLALEHQQRFELLTSYLGIFAAYSSSLDARLDSDHASRDLIVHELKTLEGHLQQGEPDPQDMNLSLAARLTKRIGVSSFVFSDAQDLKGSSSRSGQWQPSGNQSEELLSLGIQVVLNSIKLVIDRLYRLAAIAQNITPSDFFENRAGLIIRGLYPGISESLLMQLAKSISQRRTRLRRQRHEAQARARQSQATLSKPNPDEINRGMESEIYSLPFTHLGMVSSSF